MYRLAIILLLLAAAHGGSRAQEHAFSVSPLLSYDRFHTLGFTSGIDFGAQLIVATSPNLRIALEGLVASRDVPFDLVQGTQVLQATIFAYGCSVELPFLGHDGGSEVAATMGAGGATSKVDARVVSLGALGSITVPARTDSRGFVQAGLLGTFPLSSLLDIVVYPAYRLFLPLSRLAADLSIAGGLRVRIF